jgi:hypothetical protein
MNPQAAKILAILRTADGNWVSALELARVSLQYSARIFELRRLGHEIENKTVMSGRRKYGYFRLVPQQSAAMRRAMDSIRPRGEAATPTTLFDNEQLHRDDG